MNILKILFIFTLSLTSFAQQSSSTIGVAEEKVEVVLGIDKVLQVDFRITARSVQVANQRILKVQPVNTAAGTSELVLKGEAPGITSVTVRNRLGAISKRYLVTVTATEKSKQISEIKEQLGPIEGLEINLRGGKIFVEGKIIVPGDIGRIVKVLEDYPDVKNLVEVSPQTYLIISREMQDGLRRNNLKDVTVRFFNNSYLLEGIVNSEEESNLAVKIAATYLPDRIESLARRTDSVQQLGRDEIIKNFLAINRKPQPPQPSKLIKITAQFVELSKDYNRVFGFKWNPSVGTTGGQIVFGRGENGGTITTTSSGSFGGTINQLFPKLSSAKAAGYARIVQSGMVITKDGEKAKLSKGSERNVAVGTGEFQQAKVIEAGFNLDVTPKILQEEKINLDIILGVSSSQGTDKQTNSLDTKLIVKSRESAVVGGISINKTATEYDKDPPDGVSTTSSEDTDSSTQTFSLFSFVRSKDVSKSKEQFVVFITPEIIESASTGTEDIKRKFRKRGP